MNDRLCDIEHGLYVWFRLGFDKFCLNDQSLKNKSYPLRDMLHVNSYDTKPLWSYYIDNCHDNIKLNEDINTDNCNV